MPISIPTNELRRLSGVLGLLSSNYDGERSNAAVMTTKALELHGWTWADVSEAIGQLNLPAKVRHLASAPSKPSAPQTSDEDLAEAHILAAEYVRHIGLLDTWEAEFTRGMLDWSDVVSPRQLQKLQALVKLVQTRSAQAKAGAAK